MSVAAVLPIKRFASAKQRLALDERADVMRDMATRVLGALEAAERLGDVYVVTGDDEAASLARARGAQVVGEGPPRGHSGAASLGVAHAAAHGASTVLLVAGDCPLLTGAELDDLVDAHPGPGVVVLADRHGTGTNGLLLTPPDVIAPAFGPGSRERHERLAREAGVPCITEHRPAFALDVDTVDDLAAVERAR